jgi:murein DD-endopeptidase MepM/ murein hydrolase activator NlpD
VTAEDWDSIDGAEVTCTGDYGWIAAAAGDGGKHNGMGNYVQVRHLVCSQRCGRAGEEAGEKHHITLLERDAAACVEPAPPPDDYGTLVPTPTPSTPDLLLDCIEDDWRAYYFHLRDITVAPGDFVEFGDVLGHIDNTGNSTGPHLHYQINSPTDGAIDPAPAMCPDGYFPGLRAQYRWERGVCP